jgi:hypothetical protein
MFPTFGRGERKGMLCAARQELSQVAYSSDCRAVGNPTLSRQGTHKDTQGALRHASITMTGNVYVQIVEKNVMGAVNSHALTVLEGWTSVVEAWDGRAEM